MDGLAVTLALEHGREKDEGQECQEVALQL